MRDDEYPDEWRDTPYKRGGLDPREDPVAYAMEQCDYCEKRPDPSLESIRDAISACQRAGVEWRIVLLLEDLKPASVAKLERADWVDLMGSPNADVREMSIRLQR